MIMVGKKILRSEGGLLKNNQLIVRPSRSSGRSDPQNGLPKTKGNSTRREVAIRAPRDVVGRTSGEILPGHSHQSQSRRRSSDMPVVPRLPSTAAIPGSQTKSFNNFPLGYMFTVVRQTPSVYTAIENLRVYGVTYCPMCGADFDGMHVRPVHDTCSHLKCRQCVGRNKQLCPECFPEAKRIFYKKPLPVRGQITVDNNSNGGLPPVQRLQIVSSVPTDQPKSYSPLAIEWRPETTAEKQKENSGNIRSAASNELPKSETRQPRNLSRHPSYEILKSEKRESRNQKTSSEMRQLRNQRGPPSYEIPKNEKKQLKTRRSFPANVLPTEKRQLRNQRGPPSYEIPKNEKKQLKTRRSSPANVLPTEKRQLRNRRSQPSCQSSAVPQNVNTLPRNLRSSPANALPTEKRLRRNQRSQPSSQSSAVPQNVNTLPRNLRSSPSQRSTEVLQMNQRRQVRDVSPDICDFRTPIK